MFARCAGEGGQTDGGMAHANRGLGDFDDEVKWWVAEAYSRSG